MLRFLDSIRNGTLDPTALIYAESTRRSYAMELSKYEDVEQVHTAGVNTLDIESIEGRYMLSGSSDGTVVIHDTDNLRGTPKYTCQVISKIDRNYKKGHKFSVETVQWSPIDTGMFTSSDLDGSLKIWDTNTMKTVGEFRLLKRIYQHHISPIATAHNLIAVARTTAHVTLVDLKSGCCTHELRGHSGMVMCAKWSPNHEFMLASGSCDNSLLLWDIRTPKSVLHRFDPHNKSSASRKVSSAHNGRVNGLVFSHDGFYLYSYGTDNNLFAWNLSTGCKETVNFGKIENESRKAIKFDVTRNSNPSVIFVPCQGRICVYETQNGILINKLVGHFNSVNCCVVHPFTPEVYSGANDHNILVWTPYHDQSEAYSDYLQNGDGKTRETNVTNDDWSD
uniref:Uncharacterized protein n=1 Tax=Strigamia maritima TaxID=126957 RepID=T1JNL3_STRMM